MDFESHFCATFDLLIVMQIVVRAFPTMINELNGHKFNLVEIMAASNVLFVLFITVPRI